MSSSFRLYFFIAALIAEVTVTMLSKWARQLGQSCYCYGSQVSSSLRKSLMAKWLEQASFSDNEMYCHDLGVVILKS